MTKAKREMAYVNLYVEAETLAALDEYAELVGLSRSQAANSVLSATLRDDVPVTQAFVDMVKAYMAKKKGQEASGSGVLA